MMTASWTTSSAIAAYIMHYYSSLPPYICPLAYPISCLGASSISIVASPACLYWPYLFPVGLVCIPGHAVPIALVDAGRLSHAAPVAGLVERGEMASTVVQVVFSAAAQVGTTGSGTGGIVVVVMAASDTRSHSAPSRPMQSMRL